MVRERQQKILEYIQQVGIASFGDLADKFGVSPFTIRRDVDFLAESRFLTRIKGGAQRLDSPAQFREAALTYRMQMNLVQKQKIANRAMDFVSAGDSIFLDGSTTVACFGRELTRQRRDVTVVTNSAIITNELARSQEIRLIGLGGVFDRETYSFVGFETDSQRDSIYIEKAFFSCTGLMPGEGTFENAAFNRTIKRQIAARAGKVYLLIDSTKMGRKALYSVLSCNEIDVLIVDAEPSVEDRLILEKNGMEVVVA